MLRHAGADRRANVKPNPKQVVVDELVGIRPTQGGLARAALPGERRDDRAADSSLGRVVSPYTFETLEEIEHPFEKGIMIMQHLTRNLVEAGDYGFMVGNLASATD